MKVNPLPFVSKPWGWLGNMVKGQDGAIAFGKVGAITRGALGSSIGSNFITPAINSIENFAMDPVGSTSRAANQLYDSLLSMCRCTGPGLCKCGG